jgi:hypothetical protein
VEIGLYRIRWVSETDGRLPRFLGPALRGALGHRLRRLSCVTRLPDCGDCALRFRCAYPVLFQPYGPGHLAQDTRYRRMPVPFALRVPFGHAWTSEVRRGGAVEVEMVIVGRANLDLPYYLLALADMGREGIGPSRHRMRLEEVAAWTPGGPVTVYSSAEGLMRGDPPLIRLERVLALAPAGPGRRLTVRCVTPLRIDLMGDLAYPVEFAHLVRAIEERWRALAACYGGDGPAASPLSLAHRVRRVVDRTRWVDLSRYSTRQKTRLRIGGAVGTLTYEGDEIAAFSPLLAFGEWMGVGKLTSMGFGRIEVIRQAQGPSASGAHETGPVTGTAAFTPAAWIGQPAAPLGGSDGRRPSERHDVGGSPTAPEDASATLGAGVP